MTATHGNAIEGFTQIDALPKSFVCSMRTLFDILDDQHTGYVRFTEIERRWQEDGTQGLPEGVLSSLRRVTPQNGYLSFERFCAGLQMCLVKNKPGGLGLETNGVFISPTNSLEAIPPLRASSPRTDKLKRRPRPLSAPILDQEIVPKQPLTNGHLVQPHSHSHQTENKVKEQRSQIYGCKTDIRMGVRGIKGVLKCPPPKPPRVGEGQGWGGEVSETSSLERDARGERRNNHRHGRPLCAVSSGVPRHDRGGSLERLLDAPQAPKAPTTRTGVRSALHSWFKEKSKSDLLLRHPIRRQPDHTHSKGGVTNGLFKSNGNKGIYNNKKNGTDDNNNHQKGKDEAIYGTNKENRVPPTYSMAVESAYRSKGDGTYSVGRNANGPADGDSTKTYSSGETKNYIPVAEKSYGNGGDPKGTYGGVEGSYNGVDSKNSYSGVDSKGTYGGVERGEKGVYVAPQPPQLALHKKTHRKKETPRRHTLQIGVDHNMSRRLRQLESERDVLVSGLESVESARTWFAAHLRNVQSRIHYLPLGQISHEGSLSAHEEKWHLQLARIHDIKNQLHALMAASPSDHMQLALPHADPVTSSDNNKGLPIDSQQDKTLGRLKRQNKMLTEEVSGKSDRISTLEREKASLLRELFQARASHSTHQAPPITQNHAHQNHHPQSLTQNHSNGHAHLSIHTQSSSRNAREATFM